jgi:hypothetical protein
MSRIQISIISMFSILLFSCGSVENIEIHLTNPINVEVGEEFKTVATISNTSGEDQVLYSIDIGNNYTDGFMLLSSEPSFTDVMKNSLDNTTSYSFHAIIPANSSLVVEHYWKAVKQGDYKDVFDFCINSDILFITVEQRTLIGMAGSAKEAVVKEDVQVDSDSNTEEVKANAEDFNFYDIMDFPEKYSGRTFEWEMEVTDAIYRDAGETEIEYYGWHRSLKDCEGEDVEFSVHAYDHPDNVTIPFKIHIPKGASLPNAASSDRLMVKFVFSGDFYNGNELISANRLSH